MTRLFALIIAAFLTLAPACHVGESREPPQWGYEDPYGPDQWAALSQDYALCGTGRRQSPVDIAAYVPDDDLLPLEFAYQSDSVSIRNAGDWKGPVLGFASDHTLKFGDQEFRPKSAHWHSPSEHWVDGVEYPAELHLVHQDGGGSLAVVGILYELGQPDPFLGRVLGSAPQVNETVEGIGIDVSRLPPAGGYFRYDGSKTTPPCDEPVAWYIMEERRTVSTAQVDRLLELTGGPNARPVQGIGDWTITVRPAKEEAVR